jgi:hypothetical protein
MRPSGPGRSTPPYCSSGPASSPPILGGRKADGDLARADILGAEIDRVGHWEHDRLESLVWELLENAEAR